MMRARFSITGLILLAIATFADASQEKLATDHQTIAAKISAKELTHVFVEGDRIYQVRGLDGAYELQKDENNGSIYVRPTTYFQHQSFNIFLTTEQGHVYPLLLTPVDVPAVSIQLRPTQAGKVKAEQWETQSSYEKILTELITAMATNHRPDGYAVVSLEKLMGSPRQGLQVTLQQQYRGNRLKGEVLRITNTGQSFIELREGQFYTAGIRAIALLRPGLAPNQTTFLYRVLSHD